MTRRWIDHLIMERDRNIIRVDFRRDPDQPGPRFPGAAAARRLKPFDSGLPSTIPQTLWVGAPP